MSIEDITTQAVAARTLAISPLKSPTIPKIAPTLIGVGGLTAVRQKLTTKESAYSILTHEAPAVILVLEKNTSKIVFQTNKFLLQSITKPQQEKFQVIETFGKPHVFFYGERTKMYAIQGVLIDGFYRDEAGGLSTIEQYKNKWSLSMQDFYNTELRGTRLKDNGHVGAIYVNGWLIKGYPVQLSIMKEANQMPDAVTFQMSWLVEDEILLNTRLANSQYDPKSLSISSADTLTTLNTLLKKISEYGALVEARNSLPKSRGAELKALDLKIDAVYSDINTYQSLFSFGITNAQEQ